MSNAQKIKMALAYKGLKEAELARLLGTTPQAFNQRLKTDKFTSILSLSKYGSRV